MSTSKGPLPRKISRPPGRRTRAASGIQRYGSHQMAAPYSLIARSNAGVGDGYRLGAAVDQREVEVMLVLKGARGRELVLRQVDADGPRPAARQPRRDIGGAAAQLDGVEPMDVGEEMRLGLRNAPYPPGRLRSPVPPPRIRDTPRPTRSRRSDCVRCGRRSRLQSSAATVAGNWGGQRDSNPRPPGPQPGTLTS